MFSRIWLYCRRKKRGSELHPSAACATRHHHSVCMCVWGGPLWTCRHLVLRRYLLGYSVGALTRQMGRHDKSRKRQQHEGQTLY